MWQQLKAPYLSPNLPGRLMAVCVLRRICCEHETPSMGSFYLWMHGPINGWRMVSFARYWWTRVTMVIIQLFSFFLSASEVFPKRLS